MTTNHVNIELTYNGEVWDWDLDEIAAAITTQLPGQLLAWKVTAVDAQNEPDLDYHVREGRR